MVFQQFNIHMLHISPCIPIARLPAPATPRHSGCILYQLPTHESDQHTPLSPKAQHLELVASTKLCPA